jgi:hypothetical protein
MAFEITDLPASIRSVKKSLRDALPNYAEIFQDVEAEMHRKVDLLVKERDRGHDVIPTVQYADVEAGTVSPEMIAKIKDRGACVVRQTFPAAQASAWDDEIGNYVDENGLTAKLANAAVDNYFGDLASAKPQIYGIYWSRPQVQARQSESLTRVRIFLNKLWKSESEGKQHFNPITLPRMRIVFGAVRQGRHRWDYPRTWMAARWSVGSTKISAMCIATSFPATGGSMTRLTLRGDLR